MKLGRSQIDALEDMANRIASDDLMLAVTAMRIQHETGGNLSEILETVSETIRERVRIKGELRSLTAQQRYSGYALAVLPVAVFSFLMLINPTYESRLFAPGPTLCIPIGALLTMLLGFLAIRKIVSAHEYAALGEDFEKKEHRLFGEDGFEKMVEKVAAIEKRLGIYELSKFTP